MRSVLLNLVTRVLAMVPTAAATLLATRLLLQHYDEQVFNAFTLVFSLMLLLPLNSLGLGTALTTSTAERGATHEHTQRVALTAARALTVSGLCVAVVALAISAFDGWSALLGDGAFSSAAYGIALALYGLSFVPALAQSVLLGVNRDNITILAQASFPPAMAAGVGLCVVIDAPPWAIVLVPGVAILAISLLNAAIAPRETGLHLLPLLPKLLDRKRHPGAKVGDVAGPALIVAIATPLTLQSQRLILSHYTTPDDLAAFSVTLQVFLPLLSLLPFAARPLWPLFAQQRMTGVKTVSLTKVLALFVSFTALASAALFVLAEPIAGVISDDKVELGIALPLLVAGACVLQAVALPVAMAMMYPEGLRVIARLTLIATPAYLLGSIILTPHFGPATPLWVAGVTTTFLQVIPSMVFVHRHSPSWAGPTADADADETDDRTALEHAVVDAELEEQLHELEVDAPVTLADGFTLPITVAPPEAPHHPPAPKPAPVPMEQRWREDARGRSW